MSDSEGLVDAGLMTTSLRALPTPAAATDAREQMSPTTATANRNQDMHVRLQSSIPWQITV